MLKNQEWPESGKAFIHMERLEFFIFLEKLLELQSLGVL